MYNIARIYKGYESKNNMSYEKGGETLEIAKHSLDYLKRFMIERGADVTASYSESFTVTDENTGADIVYKIEELVEIKNMTQAQKMTHDEKMLMLYLLLYDIRGDWSDLRRNRARFCLALQLTGDLGLDQDFLMTLVEYHPEAHDDARWLRQLYEDDDVKEGTSAEALNRLAAATEFPVDMAGRSKEFVRTARRYLVSEEIFD